MSAKTTVAKHADACTADVKTAIPGGQVDEVEEDIIKEFESSVMKCDAAKLRVLATKIDFSKTKKVCEAAWRGDTTIVNILLDNGANVNERNEYGHTPIFSTIIRKDYEMFELLVVRGADVEAIDNNGRKFIDHLKQYCDSDDEYDCDFSEQCSCLINSIWRQSHDSYCDFDGDEYENFYSCRIVYDSDDDKSGSSL